MGSSLRLTLAQSGFRLLDMISYRFFLKAVFGKFPISPRFRKRRTSPFDSLSISCQDLSPALDVATELRGSLLPFVDPTRAGRRQRERLWSVER